MAVDFRGRPTQDIVIRVDHTKYIQVVVDDMKYLQMTGDELLYCAGLSHSMATLTY